MIIIKMSAAPADSFLWDFSVHLWGQRWAGDPTVMCSRANLDSGHWPLIPNCTSSPLLPEASESPFPLYINFWEPIGVAVPIMPLTGHSYLLTDPSMATLRFILHLLNTCFCNFSLRGENGWLAQNMFSERIIWWWLWWKALFSTPHCREVITNARLGSNLFPPLAGCMSVGKINFCMPLFPLL